MNWFTDKLYDLGASPRAGEAAWGELAAQDAMSPATRSSYYAGSEMPPDPRAQGWAPDAEKTFQVGIRATPWFAEFKQKFGEEPNLNDPDYDYRRAWAAGARPTVRDPGDNLLHWSSQFKGENHPNRFVNGIDTITGKPVGSAAAMPSDTAWMLPPQGPPTWEAAHRFGASGLTPPPARSEADAYRMGGLANMDEYRQAPAAAWRDIDRAAIEDQYGGADIHGIKLPPVSQSEPRAWFDALVPQTPAEIGLTVATGPAGRVLGKVGRAVVGATGMMGELVDPAEAKTKVSSILSRLAPTAEDIAKIKGAAVQFGRRGWPTAEREVFSTDPAAYAETLKLVPQISIKDRLPGPLPGEALPIKERAAPIVASAEPIAERIAQRLEPLVEQQSPLLKFYHTGPVIRGLERYGEMGVPEANTFMRDWAGQGAATSPRTQTPPNLRNSSYLLYERASGNPLTPERYAREGNVPGFPMMGMHVDLADKFARGVENPWKNPKPTTFRENWSGNLPDVTGDTHNIRSTLFEMDNVAPGSLPRPWFSSDVAYAKYRKEGFGAVNPGDIVDTLGSKTVKGADRQSEYLPMTEPWYRAAQKLGIHPAEAQSGGWFSYGDITGLQSPPKTIVNLLNDQVDATAKVLDVSPEKVVNWWARGKIPLAGVGGAAVMGGLADQSNYSRGD